MDGSTQDLAGGRLCVRDCGPVREIRLSRPDAHNALDEDLIAGLTAAFVEVGTLQNPPRAVLLAAEGKSFCAGADLRYMQRLAGYAAEENHADALRLAAMFQAVHDCPVFVLGRIQGAALGGGCGLVAACDLAVASASARFGFTEVRLGIAPATISPFVVARIGAAKARALFPTGEIFDAAEARLVGLVDRVVAPEQLDAEIDRILELLLGAAPGAAREAKALARRAAGWVAGWTTDTAAEPAAKPVIGPPAGTAATEAAALIARLRALPEGREGFAAFLEKRKPAWTQSWPPTTKPGEAP
jgi:methylglutaconyl-CoA hydratase